MAKQTNLFYIKIAKERKWEERECSFWMNFKEHEGKIWGYFWVCKITHLHTQKWKWREGKKREGKNEKNKKK